jgi:hypothetical protein
MRMSADLAKDPIAKHILAMSRPQGASKPAKKSKGMPSPKGGGAQLQAMNRKVSGSTSKPSPRIKPRGVSKKEGGGT